MKKSQYLLKKYSALALTITSAIGTVTTAILAAKATPKVLELLKEHNDLTKLDKVKIAWKPYLPAGISCFATLSCIFGAHYLNVRSQASLVSAYMFIDNSYKEYIAKTKELYGEDADKRIKSAIIEKNIDDIDLDNDSVLFFDYDSMRYFENTVTDVLKAEDILNQEFAASGIVTLNDLYRLLNMPLTIHGDEYGWIDHGDYYEIEFMHQKTTLNDGLECYILTSLTPYTNLIY